MKLRKSLLLLLLIIVVLEIGVGNVKAEDEYANLIKKYADCVNDKDVESYEKLFDSSVKNEIKNYVSVNGETDFFKYQNISVVDIKKIKHSDENFVAELSEKERNTDGLECYYVQLKSNSKNIFQIFVMEEEQNSIKILRISAADITKMKSLDEDFGTDSENNEQMAQLKRENKYLFSSLAVSSTAKSTLKEPTYITVYFTKGANRTHFQNSKATISFESYVENVTPNEFVTSYYDSYPAYKKSTTMVAKMYGWYHKLYPKWNFAPYFADVKDNTDDQVYLYGSANSYSKEGWKAVSGKALVNSSDSVFETQFLANSGKKGGGILNSNQALNKAKNGEKWTDILKYYYDNSSNAKNKTVKIVNY